MSCYDWQTFKDGFWAAWRRKTAGELLIDWPRARVAWKRYHCTGAEAAKMQLLELAMEAEYLWFLPRRPDDESDGDGGARPHNPTSPRPLCPAAA